MPLPSPPPGATTKEATAAPPPDYEAHYTLGVAYKNMGLYEEAKEEFQVSMNSESFYLDSAPMTAVCLKEGHHIDSPFVGSRQPWLIHGVRGPCFHPV
ncbi:MAG: tetratricopeptide repeat protein [Nitrospira sp.]|nr:tetratricopeptide repeat protein [Nitrospira sp.]